jgi:hypothetical protein
MDLLVDVQLHGFVKEVEEVLPGPGRATLAEHLAGFYVERSERSYSAGLSVGGSHAPVVKSWRRASSLSSPHLVAVSR